MEQATCTSHNLTNSDQNTLTEVGHAHQKMVLGARILAHTHALDNTQSEKCAAYGGPVILRIGAVQLRVGLKRSSIYARINPKDPRYDPTFPKQIHLSAHSVGWVESEIFDWVISRITASRRNSNTGAENV
mgnify:CR=1 FL=1